MTRPQDVQKTISQVNPPRLDMVRLEDLGEKEVVSRMISILNSDVAVGPGDDAACIDLGDSYLVVSTDLITGGSHSPQGMTDHQMGWMAAAVNLSDIAAMGARPLGVVMAMALPRDLEVERVMDMVRGAEESCLCAGTSLVGGDTKEGVEIVLTGTAVGIVEKERLLTRSGARPGDLLAVTGRFGLPSAGLLSIEKGINFAPGRTALMEPTPRTEAGRLLSLSGVVTSCIDVSDGLAHSVHLLSEASGVGFEVEWSAIPIGEGVEDLAEACSADLEELVLYFGGEYQLLFTIDPSAEEMIRAVLPEVKVIGKGMETTGNVLRRDREVVDLENLSLIHI